MFKEERDESAFDWSMIGDISVGRPNLGSNMDVAVYRLMQFTVRDVLIQRFGPNTAADIFHAAGEVAGSQFFQNLIKQRNDFSVFLKEVTELLATLKIGILRVEKADLANLNFTLTIAEDLECSGVPMCEETICSYDEGFIGGLLREFIGKKFQVKEVDCWCSGARVCRFDVKPAT